MNKSATRFNKRSPIKPYCAVLLCCAAAPAYANPSGGLVVNGQASFASSGNTLTVTNTPGTVINWQNFSIGSNEVTQFAQQSAASAVLNRVTGSDPSNILGSLQSNGRVYLINPNGILFGAGAKVDTAGLVASTLNLSNADFLAGRNNYTQVPGAQNIGNAGNINVQDGGQVYLIAPNVENSGVITAPNGEILLAAGASVELVSTSNPNLRVNITAPAGDATNVGQLIASSGSLGLFGTVVKNSGAVNADSATLQGGRIVFRASQRAEISGSVSANGVTGGTIEVLGNQVGVMDGAAISANGTQGGGTALIGGDAHGANPDVPNALVTYVAPTSTISADGGVPSPYGGGLGSGNGGKVIVWSDNTTRAYGSLTARGGAGGGNGGFIETSGHFLAVTQAANVGAPKGKGGIWLLDPYDVSIQAATGTLDALSPNFLANANSSTVSSAVIQAALAAGTSVVVSTNTSVIGAQAGNITVDAPISAAVTGVGTTLTLNAISFITINQPITSTGAALNLVLNHGVSSSATLANTVSLAGGNVNVGTYVGSVGMVTPGVGTLNVTAGATTLTGSLTASTLGVTGATAQLNLNGAAATSLTSLKMTAGTLTSSAALSIGTLTVNPPVATTITLGGAGTKTVTGTTTFAPGGSFVLPFTLDSATLNTQGAVSHTVNGTSSVAINLANGAAINNTATWGMDWITVQPGAGAAGTFNNNGATGAITLSTLGASGAINTQFNNNSTLASAVNLTAGTFTLGGGGTSSGTFNIATGATLNFSAGTHNLSNASAITGTGTVVFSGGTDTITGSVAATILTNSGATTNLNGAMTSPTVNVSAGTLNLNNTLGTSIAALNLSGGTLGGTGAITIPAGGTFAWSGGALASTGGLTVAGTSGAATLTGNLTLTGGLLNNGMVNQGAATMALSIGSGGNLINNGTFNLAVGGAAGSITVSDSGIFTNNPSGLINSAGAVSNTVQAAVGTTVGTIVNNGTVNVAAGNTLNWIGGQATTHAGSWNAGVVATPAAGGVLTLGEATGALAGAQTYSGPINVVGTLNVTSGANTLSGALTNNGQLQFSTGSNNLTGTYSDAQLAGGFMPNVMFTSGTNTISALSLAGGALTFSSLNMNGGVNYLNTASTVHALVLSAGTLTGTGNITIPLSASFNWYGGTLATTGTASITLNNVTATTAQTTLMNGTQNLNRALINNGLVSQQIVNAGSQTTLNIGAGGSFTNNGTLNLGGVANGTLSVSDTGVFTNASAGIVNSTGAVINTIQAAMGATSVGTIANSGTVNVAAGNTLRWTAGQTSTSAGVWKVGSAITPGGVLTMGAATGAGAQTYIGIFTNYGTVEFMGGTNNLTNPTAAISGNGTVNFGGGANTLTGSVTATTVNNSGATTNLNGAVTASAINVSLGTLNLNTAANIASLGLSGGTLGGTGSLTVTTSYTQTTGVLASSFSSINITQATGNLSVGGISALGSISLAAPSGVLAINGPLNAGIAAINLTSASAIIGSGGLSTTGLLTTNSVGGTTLNGANTVGSFKAVNSGSGNISLTNSATALNLSGISQTGGGAVSITNTGNIATSALISSGGNINIYAVGNAGDDVTIGNGINYTGTAAAGNLEIRANRNITVQTSPIQVTGTQALNVILNADRNADNSGAVYVLAGGNISTAGGNIAIGGGNGAIGAGTGFAHGDNAAAGYFNGVSVQANLAAAGGNIVINGIADALTTGLNTPTGVEIVGGTVSTTGTGTITLTGTSMNSGAATVNSWGINIGNLTNGPANVTSVDGAIQFDGTSGSGANAVGARVYRLSNVQATGLGNVTINGTAGNAVAAINNTRGVAIDTGSFVRTNGGVLTLNGVNTSIAGSTGFTYGVDINGDSLLSSVSGAVNIAGSAVAGSSPSVAGVMSRLTIAGNTIGNGTSGNILLDAKGGTGIILGGANVKGSGNITLNVEGGGAITQTGGYLQAGLSGLRVLGDTAASAVTLNSAANNVSHIAASLPVAGSSLSYTNSAALIIDNITSVAVVGLSASSSNGVTVNGNITLGAAAMFENTLVTPSLISGALLTISTAGGATLNNANAVTGFTATNSGSGDIRLTNSAANLTVAVISNTAVNGGLMISNTGALTTSGAVSSNGNISLAATGAMSIGASVAGGNIALSGAAISEAAAGSLNTPGLLGVVSTGGATLTGANALGSFNATNSGAGNISLTNTAANLTVTGISNIGGVAKVSNSGAISMTGAITAASISGQASGITLGAAGLLSASGAGNAIVLDAGAGNFINNAGATALTNTGGGRWLVYSSDPALDTFGGLASGNLALWGKTSANYAPASVVETGNRYLFAFVPVLAVSAALSKTYSTDLTKTPPAATILGLVNAASYGNVFSQDAIQGSASLTSTGFAANAGVLGSPYLVAVAAGTQVAPVGYGATIYSNGTITVNPAPLTVTANMQSKLYGTSDPVLIYAVTGLQLGDTPTTVLNAGLLSRVAGEAAGTYQINQGTLGLSTTAGTNYTLTYVPGSFAILMPALLNGIVNIVASTPVADMKQQPADRVATTIDVVNPASDTSIQSLPMCK
ncbi:MAG: filamentous hemagglutinin N-terminal domain-containing protein [Nitrosomonadales bacterium]|nr:filamentous hemagglutinin N-terminal domain-containing protein [Nitrosomonadales bacterium]